MKESIKFKNFREEGEWGGGKVQIGTASHSLVLLQSEFLHVHCIEIHGGGTQVMGVRGNSLNWVPTL